MQVKATGVLPYRLQSFDEKGNSRDYPAVATMAEIDEQIVRSNAMGYKNHTIYNVTEVRAFV